MQDRSQILIVDDDPSHLQIYGWILRAAGYSALPVLVVNRGLSLPADAPIALAILDYRLTGTYTAVEAAQEVRKIYPEVPIILLSDIYGMPDDIAPYAATFVRKGEPEKLVATVAKFLSSRPRPEPEQGVA